MTDEAIKVDNKNGVTIQSYKGTYGLLAMEMGHNETFYKRWVFLSQRQNQRLVASEKKVPMGIRLGDKEKALAILRGLLKRVQNDEVEVIS